MTQETIELDIPKPQCRMCKSFIRVRDSPDRSDNNTPYDRLVMRNGFCLLGKYRTDGDFSLYFNDISPDCNCYCYDLYNAETTAKEKILRDYINNLTDNIYDRRTKEYKLLNDFRNALKKSELITKSPTSIMGVPISDKDMQNALYRLQDDKLMRYTAKLYLSSICRDQISEIGWRKSMSYKEYCKVLGKVRFELSEAFDKSLQECIENPM